jgi:hypothetical protein
MTDQALVPRKVELEAREDGEKIAILLGGRDGYELEFTFEEWRRLLQIMPSKVQIEEKRPLIALFGTKTEIRWIETPKQP